MKTRSTFQKRQTATSAQAKPDLASVTPVARAEETSRPEASQPRLSPAELERRMVPACVQRKALRDRMALTKLSPEEAATRFAKLQRRWTNIGVTATLVGGGVNTCGLIVGVGLVGQALLGDGFAAMGVVAAPFGVLTSLGLSETARDKLKLPEKVSRRNAQQVARSGLAGDAGLVLKDLAQAYVEASPEQKAALAHLAQEWLDDPTVKLRSKARKGLEGVVADGQHPEFSPTVARLAAVMDLRFLDREEPAEVSREVQVFVDAWNATSGKEEFRAAHFETLFGGDAPVELGPEHALRLHELLAAPQSPSALVDDVLRRARWLNAETLTPARTQQLLAHLSTIVEEAQVKRLREGLSEQLFGQGSMTRVPRALYRELHDAVVPHSPLTLLTLIAEYAEAPEPSAREGASDPGVASGAATQARTDAVDHVVDRFKQLSLREQTWVEASLHEQQRVGSHASDSRFVELARGVQAFSTMEVEDAGACLWSRPAAPGASTPQNA